MISAMPGWLDGLGQDMRLALRGVRQHPGFATAAAATLAIGIGASAAIFSVAYGVSLRPLPYLHPDRLIRIYEANPANAQPKHDVSVATFHEWREGSPSLESAALFSTARARTRSGPSSERLTTMSVSPAFFDVLGVRLLLGKGFKREVEYTSSTAVAEVILSYHAWHRLFGGRHDVIGAPLSLRGVGDDDVYRVVGVLPESFAFIEPVDVWPAQIVELPVAPALRKWRDDRVIARLKPGTTIETARAQLEVVAARLARDVPATHSGWTVTVESMHESIVGTFSRATWLLLAAVAVVLLIACLNVGGLLVARAVRRERETAVRVALGAGSWRLVRLWLAEAFMLGVAGAAIGLLLAWSGVSALKAAAPPGIPRLDAIALDWPTLVVAAISTLVAVVTFTVAPISRARWRELSSGLRAGSWGVSDRRGVQLARGALILAQCAGAATLVVLAVMLTRSFLKLTSVDLGWDSRGVLSVQASPPVLPQLRRPWYRRVEWSDRLLARLEATPGVDRAAIATQVPLSPSYSSTLARGRGKSAADDSRWPAIEHKITDRYFELMGIRLVSGRMFGPEDRFGEAQLNRTARVERGVAIVTEQTARMLWPGQPAKGQALWLPEFDNAAWREVIGVVEDIQFHAVGEEPALHVFLPWTQNNASAVQRVLVKTSGTVAAIAATVRDVLQAVEPGTAIDDVASLESLVARATAQPRFTSRVVASFGVLALALAGVGIYGTLSFLVGARTREIGIRVALGASRGSILRNVIWHGAMPAIGGGALGFAVALALGRTFRALLFEIQPFDPISFAGGAAALLAVVFIAAIDPARRASRVDPACALRTE